MFPPQRYVYVKLAVIGKTLRLQSCTQSSEDMSHHKVFQKRRSSKAPLVFCFCFFYIKIAIDLSWSKIVKVLLWLSKCFCGNWPLLKAAVIFILPVTGPRILLESKMSFNSPVISEDDQKNHQGIKRNFEGLNSSDSQTTSMLQETPLENLHLAPQTVLERAPKQGRSKCPRCNSSRMFYCYTCYVPVETVPTGEIPVVKVSARYILFLI